MQAIDEYREIIGQVKLSAEEKADLEAQAEARKAAREQLRARVDKLTSDPLSPERVRRMLLGDQA